jgi:hypothetical protein
MRTSDRSYKGNRKDSIIEDDSSRWEEALI